MLRWAGSFQQRRCLKASFSSSRAAFVVHGDLPKLSKGAIPAVGAEAHVTHAFTTQDTAQFAALTGDSNPIHTDAAAALEHTGMRAPVVQGMLSASLFATIFGQSIPGSVYISQALRWRTPLLVDEPIKARIRVVHIRKRFVDCETVCKKTSDGAVVVEGSATVLLPKE